MSFNSNKGRPVIMTTSNIYGPRFLSNDPRAPATCSSSPEPLIMSSSVASGAPLSRYESTSTVADLDKEDAELQEVLADEGLQSDEEPATDVKEDPYKDWQCAFGWQCELDAVEAVPKSRGAFKAALVKEINAVAYIDQGLASYIKAIHSGEHHIFTHDFLTHQDNAYEKASKQLETISENLNAVADEVSGGGSDDEEVHQHLHDAFMHAKPWIVRTRRILVESHVFYKINYVLASNKKTIEANEA